MTNNKIHKLSSIHYHKKLLKSKINNHKTNLHMIKYLTKKLPSNKFIKKWAKMLSKLHFKDLMGLFLHMGKPLQEKLILA